MWQSLKILKFSITLAFETSFRKNKNLLQKNGVSVFQVKVLRLKSQYFLTKLSCQKLMLRQARLEKQNGPIRKNEF